MIEAVLLVPPGQRLRRMRWDLKRTKWRKKLPGDFANLEGELEGSELGKFVLQPGLEQ